MITGILILSLILSVSACQSSTSTTKTSSTTTQATSVSTVTTTTTKTTTTAQTTITSTPTVSTTTTTPIVGPNLPAFVSLSTDKAGPDLQGVDFARVTAVFLFDTKEEPGYYYINLLSDNDSFGAQTIEWYRATKQVPVTWQVYAGHDAYYRLKNNEPVANIFKTQITYSMFVSLNTVASNNPSDLEKALADRINAERNNRHLSILAWDSDLYNRVLPRLTTIGHEGVITPPPTGQSYLETAYVSTGGSNEDVISIFQNWIINEGYYSVVTNPNIKSFAIRSDRYNNHKFYVVGLYK
jgi:hypothetical protein